MLAATLAVWLAQAPAPIQPGFTPSVKEWQLGGAFRLRRENFLRWQPVFDPFRGWNIELRPAWLVELEPTHPRLSGLSFAVDSAPGTAAAYSFGIVRPRLQYRIADTQTRVGVELPIALSSTPGAPPRVFRPIAFVSGRF